MASYNNVYNFKNSVRHFFDIDNLIFDSPEDIVIENTCWTKPVKFRVLKDSSDFRTLKFPNIIQLAIAYEHYKTLPCFNDSYALEKDHKRLKAKLDTGDFAIGSFEESLQEDFNRLCIYDNLLRLDIKEYYGRIYTHDLDFGDLEDRYLTNLNYGATNGIIMGNYLSLYFAEQYLVKISQQIDQELKKEGIFCEYSYFSDDFYFFCNSRDNQRIIKIFDKALERFDLERNTGKTLIYDYHTYTEETIMTRYWKRINQFCNTHFKKENGNNRLTFINQLVYRISNFSEKNKRTFINSFFKGKYFYEIQTKLEKYALREYDYHELCYLYRTSPEALLYSIELISRIPGFEVGKVKKFFEIRYKESLQNPQHDVQLYYYYAIKVLCIDDILKDTTGDVIKTENQILISYYLSEKLFDSTQIDDLKQYTDESHWLQNYHLILYTSELKKDLQTSINTYLIPEMCRPCSTGTQSAKKLNQRATYYDFYKENLDKDKSIIAAPKEISTSVNRYLKARFLEETELMAKMGKPNRIPRKRSIVTLLNELNTDKGLELARALISESSTT